TTQDDPEAGLAAALSPAARRWRDGATRAAEVGRLSTPVHRLALRGVAGLSAGSVPGLSGHPAGLARWHGRLSAAGVATRGRAVGRLPLTVLTATIGVLRWLVVRSVIAHGSPSP